MLAYPATAAETAIPAPNAPVGSTVARASIIAILSGAGEQFTMLSRAVLRSSSLRPIARNFMSSAVASQKLTAQGFYDSMRANNIDGFYGEWPSVYMKWYSIVSAAKRTLRRSTRDAMPCASLASQFRVYR